MALWQFAVFAALIGVLLVYAGVLTRRIGHANAALQRIEEALLARNELTTAAAAEVVEATQSPEVSGEEGGVPRYLTVRDLNTRGEVLRNSRAKRSAAESPDSRMEREMRIALMNSFAARREKRNAAAASSEGGDAVSTAAELPSAPVEASSENEDMLSTTGELSILQASDAENVDSRVATSEGIDVLSTSEEPPNPSDSPAEEEDSEARKAQDALLVRSNQRRRRRARQGY